MFGVLVPDPQSDLPGGNPRGESAGGQWATVKKPESCQLFLLTCKIPDHLDKIQLGPQNCLLLSKLSSSIIVARNTTSSCALEHKYISTPEPGLCFVCETELR